MLSPVALSLKRAPPLLAPLYAGPLFFAVFSGRIFGGNPLCRLQSKE